LSAMKEDLKREHSAKSIDMLQSLFTGFLFCSGPICSSLAINFGCRTVVMGGAIVNAMMYILTVYAPSLYVMYITYGIMGGIATGCAYITSLIVIADWFDKKRGIATGITMAGSGVGNFVMAPLMTKVLVATDWKTTMAILGCIQFQVCMLGSLFRPVNPIPKSIKKIEMKNVSVTDENNNNHNNHEDENDGGEEENIYAQKHLAETKQISTFHGSVLSLNQTSASSQRCYEKSTCLTVVVDIVKEMTDLRLLCESTGFLLISLSNWIVFTGYFPVFLYITDIAVKAGHSPSRSAWLLSAIGIVNIPMRMLVGFLADRRIVSAINLNTFSVLICAVSLLSLQFLVTLGSFYALVGFAVLFATGMAGMNSLTTMYLCDLVGLKKFSKATGIINLFRGVGCFLGPVLAGYITELFGGNQIICFYFMGALFLVGFALSAMVSFQSTFGGGNKEGNDTEDFPSKSKSVDHPDSTNNNLLNQQNRD